MFTPIKYQVKKNEIPLVEDFEVFTIRLLPLTRAAHPAMLWKRQK